MHVAYLVNQYPQPSHTFIRREIAALERAGVRVSRYTLRASDGPLVDAQDIAERARTRAVLSAGALTLIAATVMRAIASPLAFGRALAAAWRLGRRSDRGRLTNLVYFAEACVLLRWLRSDGIGHVHAHFGTNAAAVAMLVRLLGGPTYSFTVHGPEEFDKPEALHLGEKVAHAAFVATVSQFGRSQLCRWSRLADWDKIRVVHCGLDRDYLAAERTPPPAARALVCVARLHEQKGLFVLLEAARTVRDRSAAFELTIIGDGPLRGPIESELKKYSLGDTVRLVGWQDAAAIRAILAQSRAFVLASFAEGLPVVIMEALALGRPVIGTYIAGIPELVIPDACGWLVPAGDSGALAEAMEAALDAQLEMLVAMGDAGRVRVGERHDCEKEAAKLIDYFAEAKVEE